MPPQNVAYPELSDVFPPQTRVPKLTLTVFIHSSINVLEISTQTYIKIDIAPVVSVVKVAPADWWLRLSQISGYWNGTKTTPVLVFKVYKVMCWAVVKFRVVVAEEKAKCSETDVVEIGVVLYKPQPPGNPLTMHPSISRGRAILLTTGTPERTTGSGLHLDESHRLQHVGSKGPPSEYKFLGNCKHVCQHCGALIWYEERVKAVRLFGVMGSRQYGLPSGDSVGAFIFENGPHVATDNDVIIEERSGHPQRIKNLHQSNTSL
ncbi:hypothetical protein Tco_0564880 [Tanacetum coccineum]